MCRAIQKLILTYPLTSPKSANVINFGFAGPLSSSSSSLPFPCAAVAGVGLIALLLPLALLRPLPLPLPPPNVPPPTTAPKGSRSVGEGIFVAGVTPKGSLTPPPPPLPTPEP